MKKKDDIRGDIDFVIHMTSNKAMNLDEAQKWSLELIHKFKPESLEDYERANELMKIILRLD